MSASPEPHAKEEVSHRVEASGHLRIEVPSLPADGDGTDWSGSLQANTERAEAVPGGFAYAPAGMRHYGWTTGETVVQIDANGLFWNRLHQPGG
jgi:hypothetical protein